MSNLSIRAPLAWLGTGGLTADVQIDLDGGVIASVGRVHPVPEDTDVLAADGIVIPAAADRHVHIGLADPAAVLARGVTAVRDLGWPADSIFPLADLSELPNFDGPLIRAAGPMMTVPGGYPTRDGWAPPGTGREISGPEEAAAAVKELTAAGATAIKVSLNAEAGPVPSDAELTAICDAAHEAELPVTTHTQGAGQVERALGAGVDELAHTPWTHRLSDDVVARCAATMRIVSTLDSLGFGRDTPALRTALDNLRRFHDAGGTVIYGTDLGNGSIPPGIHTRELLLLREAGLTNEEIVLALTRAPIEPGAPADLIVIGRDPLRDLAAFDDIRMVVRAGRVAPQPAVG
ncbi:MAG: amidohydrolase [Actinobacteria bacterium]|nr:MAG: amidohydrolase [Actinomycetota bacterium]